MRAVAGTVAGTALSGILRGGCGIGCVTLRCVILYCGRLLKTKTEVRHDAARAALRTRCMLCRLFDSALTLHRFSSLVDGLLNQLAGLLIGGVVSVRGGVISSVLAGGRLGNILNLRRVSVGRVQVIHLLDGLNRLVLLNRALFSVLFSSSFFGSRLLSSVHSRFFHCGCPSYLFALCNNLGESVRRRTLRQLLSRLHGDGDHGLLRMHRNVTGRHLRHNRLFRHDRLLRCYRLLGLNNVLGSLRACRRFSFTLSGLTLCSFLSLTLCSFLSLTLHTLRTFLRTLLTMLRKTLAALGKTLTSRCRKAHQTLTQVRALIRKTR